MRRRWIRGQAVAIRLVAVAAFTLTTGLAAAQSDSMPLPGGALTVPAPEIDPVLSAVPSASESGKPIQAVLTFFRYPTAADVLAIEAVGVQTLRFRALPMVGVQGTRSQVLSLAALPGLRSIYSNRRLAVSLDPSIRSAGWVRSSNEAECAAADAVIDSGTDVVDRELMLGRAIQSVKLAADPFGTEPLILEGLTDATGGPKAHSAAIGAAFAGGHSVAAGESRLIRIRAGDRPSTLSALQAFDWILQNRVQREITAICDRLGAAESLSPEDPVNLTSKIAHDAGLVVAAGDRADRRRAE